MLLKRKRAKTAVFFLATPTRSAGRGTEGEKGPQTALEGRQTTADLGRKTRPWRPAVAAVNGAKGGRSSVISVLMSANLFLPVTCLCKLPRPPTSRPMRGTRPKMRAPHQTKTTVRSWAGRVDVLGDAGPRHGGRRDIDRRHGPHAGGARVIDVVVYRIHFPSGKAAPSTRRPLREALPARHSPTARDQFCRCFFDTLESPRPEKPPFRQASAAFMTASRANAVFRARAVSSGPEATRNPGRGGAGRSLRSCRRSIPRANHKSGAPCLPPPPRCR